MDPTFADCVIKRRIYVRHDITASCFGGDGLDGRAFGAHLDGVATALDQAAMQSDVAILLPKAA